MDLVEVFFHGGFLLLLEGAQLRLQAIDLDLLLLLLFLKCGFLLVRLCLQGLNFISQYSSLILMAFLDDLVIRLQLDNYELLLLNLILQSIDLRIKLLGFTRSLVLNEFGMVNLEGLELIFGLSSTMFDLLLFASMDLFDLIKFPTELLLPC